MPSVQFSTMATAYYKYDESYILKGALCFKEFQKFYVKEYEPIKKNFSVDWYVFPDLWNTFRDYALQGVGKRTGNNYICLEWEPVTPNDAFLVAHELGHILRKYNRLQLHIVSRSSVFETKKLAEIFGSMLDDSVINSRLQDVYDFNPAYHYTEIELRDSINEISGIQQEPGNDFIRLSYVFYYTNQLLRWDSITDSEAIQKWSNYKNLFRSKLRSLAESGEELYYIIKENGYDIPEKQKQIFNKISDKYMINGVRLGDLLDIE